MYVLFFNISLKHLSHLSPEGLEKTYVDFSNNTFSTDRGIINLFQYIWEILFIHINTYFQ